MAIQIHSGVPRLYSTGKKDSSGEVVPVEPLAIPTHLPKIYIFAETGDLQPDLAVGGVRQRLWGTATFDDRSKFFTHTTVLANIVNAQANMQMIQRVLPPDHGPKATLRHVMDILVTQVPDYERMPDGTYKLDEDSQRIPTGETISGISIKHLMKRIPLDGFGAGSLMPGIQQDGVTQSIQYPIEDLEVPHFGSLGNNVGLRNWSPVAVGANPFDTRLLTVEKVYPFTRACIKRVDEFSTGKLVSTADGDTQIQFTLKPGSFNRYTDQGLYLGDEFIDRYQDLEPAPGISKLYGPFGAQYLYQENIDELLELMYTLEAPWVTEFSDITGTDMADEKYLMNLYGAHSSMNVPYTSAVIDFTGEEVVRMSPQSVFYATGASDGTMNEDVLAELVADEVAEYNNPDSKLMDMAYHVESIMYDSGFPLKTKKAMCNFIAIRKDTAVVLATHDVLGRTLTAAEESSLAISLRTTAELFPESEVHGTPVCRAVIVGRSGELTGSRYTKRLPLTIELAHKAARYMGAANGRWRSGQSFSRAGTTPGSIVELFRKINVTFTSDRVRNTDWANGLVWVQNYDRDRQFFPAFQTVYQDDTSVLNSFFTMMATVELEKAGFRSWLNYTGDDKLTAAELKKNVVDDINLDIKDRFDNRFILIPEVKFTAADIARGYSWTTIIHIGAQGMKTANTLTIESHRFDALVGGIPEST